MKQLGLGLWLFWVSTILLAKAQIPHRWSLIKVDDNQKNIAKPQEVNYCSANQPTPPSIYRT